MGVHLLSQILFSPLPLIVVVVVVGLWKGARVRKVTAIIIALSLYLFSTRAGLYFIANPLQSVRADKISPQLVVVLGGGVEPTNPPFFLSPTTQSRLLIGVYLAQSTGLPLLFTGGGDRRVKEGEAARRFLEWFNRFSRRPVQFWIEGDSLNTYQNGVNSLKLLRRLRLPLEIYLVTSAYHLRRAATIFRGLGFKVVPVPVRPIRLTGSWRDFTPGWDNLSRSFAALREWVALAVLPLRYPNLSR